MAGMGRTVKRSVMGPPANCDTCGACACACACTLDQAWLLCYVCDMGVFVHREHWDRRDCSACRDAPSFDCEACKGAGYVLTAKEVNLDVTALYRGYANAPARYIRDHRPVPLPIATAARHASACLEEVELAPARLRSRQVGPHPGTGGRAFFAPYSRFERSSAKGRPQSSHVRRSRFRPHT